jgi:hypothetical protein
MAAYASAKGVTLSSLGLGHGDVDLEFLNALSPLSLVIGANERMSEAISTLLTRSAASRGGLKEPSRGGLSEADIT